MKRNTTAKGLGRGPVAELHAALSDIVPQLYEALTAEDGCQEFRIYMRGDFEFLGLVKGLDAAGGPLICFGSGVDIISCFVGLEGAIAGNRWKVDKPWQDKKSD